jgi:arsenate reductase-like glutaredoxin family protein
MIILNGARSGDLKVDEVTEVARKVRKSLDMDARDILDNKPISEEAVDLMAKPLIPKWLYSFMSNRGWKRIAKAQGETRKTLQQALTERMTS